ncbi:peptide chain release factor 3 [Luteolibacter pohnpeiensis]|uniref:Peptide chain release factor 3 n=1 Tax=Luteolibacter pohnpeiensis TaxID=454153 RepID=A0A934SE27_9BACT|nr:peptide chain release factor 3 [Luteolibacter pohnpeiensis]MBK1883518.1 peptide chain release factor 3 [Luteolibacter pohnpeiensis]
MSVSSYATPSPALQREVKRRRSFAIISHPDAGKTTLTEKFLLYGGALNLAGSVTARKNQRATTSDWMDLEKQRGISVSSTVLQFEYKDCVVNILDTPGHKDFSEDTYRVLTAVDAAVMVVDAGKGIESQTRKLFEVCRRRGVPIFTFMNKMDRPARPTLDLVDELESVLGIDAYPLNWPLGDGPRFRGVYDREHKQVHLFERTAHGSYRAPVSVKGIEDDSVKAAMEEATYAQVSDELELLEGAGAEFDIARVLAGELTPVFFGSAANNFGVQLLLDRFLELAPPPVARESEGGKIEPSSAEFSAFVFKIQANMNPKHRDRVAFIRIVSGKFERDMNVLNTRSGENVRLANSQRLFARDRETVDDAFAGDVVGLVGNYDLLIGDTLASAPGVMFDEIPRFPPECFAYLHNKSTAKYKRFRDGLAQLLKEGVASEFTLLESSGVQVPLLGAVGPLQFEVLQYRLDGEYAAETRLEQTSWSLARWLKPKEGDPLAPEARPSLSLGTALARDSNGWLVALLPSEWGLKTFEDKNEDWIISEQPFAPPKLD